MCHWRDGETRRWRYADSRRSCRTSCVAAGINLWAQNKMVYSVFMSLGRLPDHSEEAAQSWDTYLVRKITDIWRRDDKKQRRVVET